jgi:hypothetical protein
VLRATLRSAPVFTFTSAAMKEPPPWSLSVLLVCPLKFPLDRLYPHNHHGSVAPDDLQ